MFSIVITEKGGAQRQLDFEGPEIGIGRLEDNDICLPKNNVSKHHARIVLKDDRYVLVDQKSTNGTYVNGRRISVPMVVRRGDKIYIGDFILTLITPEVIGETGRPSRAPSPYIEPPQPRPSQAPTRFRDSEEPSTHSFEPVDLRPSQLPVVHVTDAPARASIPQRPQEQTIAAKPPEHAPEATEHDDAPQRPSLRPPPVPHEAAHATKPPPPPPPTPSEPTLPPIVRSIPAKAPNKSIPPWASNDMSSAQGGLTSPAVLAPSVRLQGALSMLMERLSTQIDVRRPAESAFPSEHQPLLDRAIDELASEGAIAADLDRRFLRDSAISEAVGLGPLDRLLANRAVREVVIDGPARILADLGGGLSPVSAFFSGPEAVLVVARRLLHRAGKTLDTNASVHEAQLPGGGLLQLLLPPLSPKGPLISVRCPPRGQSSADSMITDGMLSADMLALLRSALQKRQNLLVVGPPGAGVSTLLGVLATLGPDHERVVIIEDMPSLSLLHAQALPLCRRAAPELDLASLLKHASRLRYDRLVIDDVTAKDALAALTSAAAGSGVLLGMHAPDPSAALTQLELFAQLGLGDPQKLAGARMSLSDLLARAVQLIVHVAPSKDGNRRVQSISEVRALPGEPLEVRVLYKHDAGSFKATEHRAAFSS